MKRLLLIVSLLTFSVIYSQTIPEKENHFQNQLNSVISKYRTSKSANDSDKILIQYKLQNERLTKAFNQVIFGNSDLVDNASAFGVSQNEEKTNVSVNTNFHLLGEAKDQLFLKIGINANGSGSLFNLYSRDEWKSSVGGNIGFIWKFAGSSFTEEKKSKHDYNNLLRDKFIKDSIAKDYITNFTLEKYKISRKQYTDLIDSINNNPEIKYKESINVLLISYFKDLKLKEEFFLELERDIKKIEALINELDEDEKEKKKKNLDFAIYDTEENINNDKIISYLIKTFWTDKSDENILKKKIENVATEFDKKNIINSGYSFRWFDFNATFNNDSFSFSEKADNIKSDIKADFDAFDADKTDINKLNTALSFNYNYARNSFRGAFYFQGGLKFNSGSFLTSNLINGTPKISNKDANGLFIIKDVIGKEAEQKVLGDFNAINQNLKYGSFSIYSAYFFGKKKIFGLNLGITHRYRITTPENTIYEKNYSILFGPIFRKPKDDDDTGLTFGIDVGVDNALYIADAKDNFVARIRVGIPFKLFDINKK